MLVFSSLFVCLCYGFVFCGFILFGFFFFFFLGGGGGVGALLCVFLQYY